MAVASNRYRTGRGGLTPSLVVFHTSEGGALTTGSAEALVAWMATPGTTPNGSGGYYGSSYHAAADLDTVVTLVAEADTAYAQGGQNQRGLSLCVTGRMMQIDWQAWLDSPGGRLAVLRVADWCHRYKIPAARLTPEQVRDGWAGLCGHNDVSKYHPASGGHTDPGPLFPWTGILARVRYLVDLLEQPAPPAGGVCQVQVRPGDGWWSVARRVYAREPTAAEVTELVDTNEHRPLVPGQWVTVPGAHR